MKLSELPSAAIQKLRGLINEQERLFKMQTVEYQILKELEKINPETTIKK